MDNASTRPAFPIAAQSYFRATNLDEQRSRFLAQPTSNPVFTYPGWATLEKVDSRIQQMSERHPKLDHSLDIVRSSMILQNDASELDNFRKLNEDAYGAPSSKNVDLIIDRIGSRAAEGNSLLWGEVLEMINYDDFVSSTSSFYEKEFQQYQNYLSKYMGGLTKATQSSVSGAISELLDLSGLSDKGWQVRLKDGASSARTVHHRKFITIGRDYQARTEEAALHIALHEVYGHALRGPQASLAESEGFAVLLEQLLNPSLKFRRSYRYLAVALGWGVFGRRFDFRGAFEVIWRIMAVNGKYSTDQAKIYAFDECYRAFRGGRPDIPGAVLLKDGIYFDANIKVWHSLASRVLCYDEFIDCIEGRRAVLV